MAITVKNSFNISTDNSKEFNELKDKFINKNSKTKEEETRVRKIGLFLKSLSIGD
ncbi:hypothetical protein [Latilactobacillus sakei]|uniref:hypothetical protein n=1 Tax=Latilactobacillus sakei TaxID=1599 RepID=UPI000A8800E4|nr:hypothetical protein [Latilactobacillus sakei]MCM1597526.1 hypothetical protein [Latilactobacillus sakei]